MASEAQKELFERLAAERQFPEGQDVASLKEKFADLPQKTASKWIERTLELPEKGEEAVPF